MTAHVLPAADRGHIHRAFFAAGIVSVLTVGASWGVLILWRIGVAEEFTGVSVHEVNAHGYAQIVGWVGLFMMGFGYQAFPRLWQTRLVAPPLARLVLGAAVGGVVLAASGLGAAGLGAGGSWSVVAALAGHGLGLVAVSVFAAQIVATARRSTEPAAPFTAFVLSALGWMVLQAGAGLWHTWTTMTAATREDLLWYVATYQAPLRDMQIHGMALLMVLGVSSRVLPQLFGVRPATPGRAWAAVALLNLAVLGEVVVFVAYRWSDQHWLAALLMVPWLLIPLAVWSVAGPWRLWRSLPRPDPRSGKFVRTSYAWLAVSLTMLVLLPVYQVVSDIPFSHAYYGAIRHAITVGFVSQMIMGLAARAVPALQGVHPRTLSRLTGPFVLLNLGCALRVTLQTLTDWHPVFFALVGLSGVLELAALTWWGAELLRLMGRGPRADRVAVRRRHVPDPPSENATPLVS
jgi:hypothetical protein